MLIGKSVTAENLASISEKLEKLSPSVVSSATNQFVNSASAPHAPVPASSHSAAAFSLRQEDSNTSSQFESRSADGRRRITPQLITSTGLSPSLSSVCAGEWVGGCVNVPKAWLLITVE